MIEKLFEFLPSLVTLFGLAALGALYGRVILPMIFGKENYKNTEWAKNWIKKHKVKASLFIGTPMAVIAGPALEELVFRGPLVIIFSQVSGYAWPAIIFSSIVFALVHYFGKTSEQLFEGIKLFFEEKDSDTQNDAEIDETHKKRTIKTIRITRTTASSIIGILTGYLGIKYQSLWLCVTIHAGWNLLAPLILPFLAILIGLGFLGISMLIEEIKWRFFKRRRLYR